MNYFLLRKVFCPQELSMFLSNFVFLRPRRMWSSGKMLKSKIKMKNLYSSHCQFLDIGAPATERQVRNFPCWKCYSEKLRGELSSASLFPECELQIQHGGLEPRGRSQDACFEFWLFLCISCMTLVILLETSVPPFFLIYGMKIIIAPTSQNCHKD